METQRSNLILTSLDETTSSRWKFFTINRQSDSELVELPTKSTMDMGIQPSKGVIHNKLAQQKPGEKCADCESPTDYYSFVDGSVCCMVSFEESND